MSGELDSMVRDVQLLDIQREIMKGLKATAENIVSLSERVAYLEKALLKTLDSVNALMEIELKRHRHLGNNAELN